MAVQDTIRQEWDSNSIFILTCHSYKSKAKKPKAKSRFRDVSLVVPAWKIIPHEAGEAMLTAMWLEAHSHLVEYYYRWHMLAVDNTQLISSSDHTTYSVVTYKVHDKYNINKLMHTHLKSRMPLFL